MSSTGNKPQAAVGRLLLVAALMVGLLGLMLGPVARAAAGVTAGALSDTPPPPAVAPVPTMLPPEAPQRDPGAPPPAPSLEPNSKNPSAPVADHVAARFEPPARGALDGLTSRDTLQSKAVPVDKTACSNSSA